MSARRGTAAVTTLLPRTEATIERLKRTFVALAVPAAVGELVEIAAELRAGEPDAARIARVHRIAHDLKGQGGTFGYPLITQLGSRLSALTRDVRAPLDPEAIEAHVQALRQVLDNQLEGDGGRAGRAVLAGLDARLSSLVH